MIHSQSNPFGLEVDGLHEAGRIQSRTSDDTFAWVPSSTDGDDERHIGVAITPRRLILTAVVAVFAILTLAGRAFALQVIDGEKYESLAEGNRIRIVRTPGERGILYDRYGAPLVENIPTLSLVVTPSDLPTANDERKKTLENLSRLTDLPLDTILEIIGGIKARGIEPIMIQNGISHENAIRLSVQTAPLPGVQIAVGTERAVLETTSIKSLGHLIGYLGRISPDDLKERAAKGYGRNDRLGKSGVESSFEDLLRGRFGKKEVEVDAAGREVTVLASEKPVDGTNIELTIDIDAQRTLESLLSRELAARGLRRGAAVAMDPTNGEVIALVSLPGFDPNDFIRGLTTEQFSAILDDKDLPLFPRAVAGTYPPGSTIKPIIAAAALTEGVITPNTTITSTGGILYANRWWFPDWKAGGHGPVSVVPAIAESVNTFFYYVGGGYEKFKGLGIERMSAYAERFGLGKALGIELPSEAAGLIPSPLWKQETKGEEWYIGDTYHFAIGQGDVLATPLQIASATAVVANGGTLQKPHLLAAFRTGKDGRRREVATAPIRTDVVPLEPLRTVRAGMRRTVTDGSAQSLMSVPVPVAGKTGTAQWNEKRANHAWFTGFAPYDNPKIVITVLLEEGGEGSTVAVPVARDFLTWYFNHTRDVIE